MKNIKLIIAYEGTSYLGWQQTPNGPSIEESLKNVLEKIFQHKISLQAASRTDAGVHANGQVVNFFTSKEYPDLRRLHISLNQLLPADIVVLEVEEMAMDFHPTIHCKSKEYHYFMCRDFAQMPQNRRYSWHCPLVSHLDNMREASKFFIGEKNYSTFCNYRKQMHYENYIREVYSIIIQEIPGNRLVFKIKGKNFLYKMVRNIVGTLAYIGRDKISISDLPRIFSSHDRTQAGITAPAHGLFLQQIVYDF